MGISPKFVFTLFGATGDLAGRKLIPALYRAFRFGNVIEKGRFLCLGREAMTREAYIAEAERIGREGLFDDATWGAFAEHIDYMTFDARNPDGYAELRERIAALQADMTIFYLSVPPALFTDIVTGLGKADLNRGDARIVLEKPLGHDLQSAQALNETVRSVFEERYIYRIDHYLGKESVQNLLALRFGNMLFEPLWNRTYIQAVTVTLAESAGVGRRGEFYDATGALRDMVQNHLLQLLCFLTMEPPHALIPDAIRDEKLKILNSLAPLDGDVIRGQYAAGTVEGEAVKAYREEAAVAPDSETETVLAMRTEILNWRWAGVPFYLMTGKRLYEKKAEIVIYFRPVPHPLFPSPSGAAEPNKLVIRLQPTDGVSLHLSAKPPGERAMLKPAFLDLDFTKQFNSRRPTAYERLLTDIIKGDLSLFVRQDELEQAWRYIEPILAPKTAPILYPAGSYGPAEARALFAKNNPHIRIFQKA